jgi:hypothetical protein
MYPGALPIIKTCFKVIIQSPPNIPYAPIELGERQGEGYSAALGCTQKDPQLVLECMRKVPGEEAMFAYWNGTILP